MPSNELRKCNINCRTRSYQWYKVDLDTMAGINECEKMPPLPHPLSSMATVCWRNQVVLLGGCNEKEKALNDVFMYDYHTGKTTALPSMLEKRFECCAVITGDTIVVMGGCKEKGKTLSSVLFFPCQVASFSVASFQINS